MPWLVSSSRGIDPTRYSRVSRTSAAVGPSAASVRTSRVDRLDRPLDVGRVHAGPNDQRTFPTLASKVL